MPNAVANAEARVSYAASARWSARAARPSRRHSAPARDLEALPRQLDVGVPAAVGAIGGVGECEQIREADEHHPPDDVLPLGHLAAPRDGRRLIAERQSCV